MEFINDDNNNENNEDLNIKRHSPIDIKKEEFNFGELLKNYKDNIKFKSNIKKEQKKKEVSFKKGSVVFETKNQKKIDNVSNILKYSFKKNSNEISDKQSLKHFLNNNKNTFKAKVSNKSLNSSLSQSSNINKISNSSKTRSSKIELTNSNNDSNFNSIKKNISNNSKKSKSNNQIKNNIAKFSKKNSLKNLNSKHSLQNKKEEETNKKSEKISINSKYMEDEPSTGNINISFTKFSTNNNYLINNCSNIGKNNISFCKKEKKNYNPYIISFFSKVNNIKTNKISNIPSTERTNSTSEKNESGLFKANNNLKLWLLLNQKNEKKINIKDVNNDYLNKTNKDQSSSIDLIDSLNESYSYVRNFIFDNYHDTKKHCQLRKKVLLGLNHNSFITDKKYKNNDSNLEMIQKLKNKSVSLEQEKEYLGYFKDLLHHNKQKKLKVFNKINSNYNSNNNDNSTGNNTCREKFYYPDVFYLNENSQLHKKTHVSYLFSKLKTNNKFK